MLPDTLRAFMKRDARYTGTQWDDPFWHVVRLMLDILPSRASTFASAEAATARLRVTDTDAARAAVAYLKSRPELVGRIVEYMEYRAAEASRIEATLLRTETEANADLQELGEVEVAKYGTRSADHHQSSKVMVATVEAVTRIACEPSGTSFDANPQSRAIVIGSDYVWVSPRRLDGALPSLFNPTAVWEIKEYWGVTGGGSKMSDAIYECQLVGQELRAFEDLHGLHVGHYVFLDGKVQWSSRRSDLRRAIDLLSSGLVDELILGREVLTEWPRVSSELCDALS